MKLKRFYEETDKEASMLAFFKSTNDSTNSDKRERMKKILQVAMSNELTDRQRDCIHLRYFEKLKAEEIANELAISTATVYKHIRTGMRSLKKCAAYL
ncbi:MAG: sigma-70 family RNA polymerase sigma factor [Clostridia bacterium]|nr:sigma-70 family RNA polymerase sigma factor [Clostridia bacterium]